MRAMLDEPAAAHRDTNMESTMTMLNHTHPVDAWLHWNGHVLDPSQAQASLQEVEDMGEEALSMTEYALQDPARRYWSRRRMMTGSARLPHTQLYSRQSVSTGCTPCHSGRHS